MTQDQYNQARAAQPPMTSEAWQYMLRMSKDWSDFNPAIRAGWMDTESAGGRNTNHSYVPGFGAGWSRLGVGDAAFGPFAIMSQTATDRGYTGGFMGLARSPQDTVDVSGRHASYLLKRNQGDIAQTLYDWNPPPKDQPDKPGYGWDYVRRVITASIKRGLPLEEAMRIMEGKGGFTANAMQGGGPTGLTREPAGERTLPSLDPNFQSVLGALNTQLTGARERLNTAATTMDGAWNRPLAPEEIGNYLKLKPTTVPDQGLQAAGSVFASLASSLSGQNQLQNFENRLAQAEQDKRQTEIANQMAQIEAEQRARATVVARAEQDFERALEDVRTYESRAMQAGLTGWEQDIQAKQKWEEMDVRIAQAAEGRLKKLGFNADGTPHFDENSVFSVEKFQKHRLDSTQAVWEQYQDLMQAIDKKTISEDQIPGRLEYMAESWLRANYAPGIVAGRSFESMRAELDKVPTTPWGAPIHPKQRLDVMANLARDYQRYDPEAAKWLQDQGMLAINQEEFMRQEAEKAAYQEYIKQQFAGIAGGGTSTAPTLTEAEAARRKRAEAYARRPRRTPVAVQLMEQAIGDLQTGPVGAAAREVFRASPFGPLVETAGPVMQDFSRAMPTQVVGGGPWGPTFGPTPDPEGLETAEEAGAVGQSLSTLFQTLFSTETVTERNRRRVKQRAAARDSIPRGY